MLTIADPLSAFFSFLFLLIVFQFFFLVFVIYPRAIKSHLYL